MPRLATLASLAALCLTPAAANAQAPPKSATAEAFALPNIDAKWTGDLDGMIKRRIVRILAPYSTTFYFVDRGVQRGLIYEIGQIFERDLNRRLKTGNVKVHIAIIPLARGEFISALRDGRGDIAMGNLIVTAERSKLVDFSVPAMKDVSEIVVTGPGAPSVNSADDLAGKEVYIARSSSFYESVVKLNAELARAGKPPVRIRLAPENLEPEDILEMVDAGIARMTVADSYIATFWKQIFTRLTLHLDVVLRTGGAVAWMIRKDSPQLRAELNAGLARYPDGSWQRTELLTRYLTSNRWAKAATSGAELLKFERTVELFKKYGARYDIDHLVVMAQAYPESELNQNARSAAGAIGIMQVMPAVGRDMAVDDERVLRQRADGSAQPRALHVRRVQRGPRPHRAVASDRHTPRARPQRLVQQRRGNRGGEDRPGDRDLRLEYLQVLSGVPDAGRAGPARAGQTGRPSNQVADVRPP